MYKVAINGLGRIGRATLKILLDTPEVKVVALNDLLPADNLAYLLRYDSVYGRFTKTVEAGEGKLTIEGSEYRLLSEKDPASLPWKDLGVDLVFECTGIFRKADALRKHIEAGAKTVVLSAPGKGGDVDMVVHGVNTEVGEGKDVFSCASCTTNCIAPVMEIMSRRFGVQKALMTTIHAYTSSQAIVDGPNKQVRRGRAGAINLVPTSTGAAVAATKALPQLQGKFDGIAVRAPVPVGSVADIVLLTERDTTAEEVNRALRDESQSDRYREVLKVTDDPIVSTDIIGDSHASIVDAQMTTVVAGNLVKILSWYDNEWGYSMQMVRQAMAALQKQ